MDEPEAPQDFTVDSDDGLWMGPPVEPPPGPEPRAALWPYYLFFHPRLFFQHFVLTPAPALTALAAWMLGISSTIDALGERSDLFSNDWDRFWVACFVLGSVSGLLYFVIGGWWYRLRLRFCGARGADKQLALRVYLFASQVCALPSIAWTLGKSMRYETPSEAFESDHVGDFLYAMFLFWSVYTSYRGVRTAFEVRRWAARFWFAILPGFFYGLLLLLMLGALVTGAMYELPQIDQPARLDRPQFTLQYPGNWSVNEEPQDFDTDRWLALESAWADARFAIGVFDAPFDPAPVVSDVIAQWSANYVIRSREPLDEWAGCQGHGVDFVASAPPYKYYIRVFAAVTPWGGFAIEQYAETDVRRSQQPGFDLIERTFRLTSK